MPDAVFADSALAARLETLAAADLATFAEAAHSLDPGSAAATLPVGGGIALFAGPRSPINQAVGLGMTREVTSADIDAAEAFFTDRATRPVVLACPLAHPSLFRQLASRGYRIAAFENALVLPLAGAHIPAPHPGVEVREVRTAEERAVYARAIVEGFARPGAPSSAEEVELGRLVAARPRSVLLLAYVDGEPAGTGELTVRDGVGWLNGDSTLPAYRRRGVQQSLQRVRLAMAREAGCELAVTDATPGSESQRNMERLGFRVAYTRVELLRRA